MYKHKLHILIIILVILNLVGCSEHQPSVKPLAESGVLDLTEVPLQNNVIKIDGQWEFFWNELIDPDELETRTSGNYIQVPSSWNKHKENVQKSGYGYATYRLRFITNEDIRLALKLPRIFTSYNLWVNGELVASAGKVGKSREEMTPQYLPLVALFNPRQGENEIVVQISNFNHRSGGILESIELGGEEPILSLRYKSLAREFIMFGSLMFIGAYQLAIFFFNKSVSSHLCFGLSCVMIGIRTVLVGERFFIYLFPDFSWEIAHKIMTLTYYLGVPLALMFFRSIYPRYFTKKMIKLSQFIGGVFGILVLLTPARVFTHINPLYQGWTVIAVIYILVVLTRLLVNKEKDAWFIALGGLALLLSSINDVVFLSIWMNDDGPLFLRSIFRIGNLSSAGQLIFAFANAILLAKKFSNSLKQERVLTATLKDINKNLDGLVLQRTKDLEKSNEKIEKQKLELETANKALKRLSFNDPLTGVWNRRKYDQILMMEWSRCMRNKRPLALVVLDLDNFKEYNDTYGHMAGDECLIKIGELLKSSILRPSDLVARYGGEEFVVLLPNTGQKEAIEYAEMLRCNIESMGIKHEKSPVSTNVTVSIGVSSMVPNCNCAWEDLFKNADLALYLAKNAGKNRVCYFPEEQCNK